MDRCSPSPVRSPASSPSFLSRACQACNGAKVKCVPGNHSDSSSHVPCVRCFRLKKECLPVPHKTRKRRTPATTTRTAKLEERLEELVSLLAAKQQPSSLTQNPSKTGTETATDSSFSSPSSLPSNVVSSPSEATELLSIYKTRLAPNFPFVLVPEHVSAQELQQRSPFLYESILMVATYNDVDRQAAMSKELLQTLTTSIVLKGETSLDLLQAVLVYTAWLHYHSQVIRVTSVLHLAIGLVADLGLKSRQCKEKRDVIGYVMTHGHKTIPKEVVHSPDEKRAYLGCRMLASMASMCLKGPDKLPYSQYVDDCCESLSSQAEYGSDFFLAVTVRFQCIIDRIQDTFYTEHTSSNCSRTPLKVHVDFFRKELEAFKASLPFDIQQGPHFALHYHNAEMNLYESAIQKPLIKEYGSRSLQQLDLLHGALVAVQQFFNILFAMPSDFFVTLSFLNLGKMSFSIATLFKLSNLDAPGWDLNHVRQTVDISTVLDRLIDIFEHAMNPAATQEEIANSQDCYAKGSRRMRRVRDWWAANPPTAIRGPENQLLEMAPGPSDLSFDMHDSFSFFPDIPWQEVPVLSWPES